MKLSSPTFIGQVSAVRGGEVTVRLRSVPTTLVMVDGEVFRIGQIGSFVRVPLGFTELYGVCTQVGASAAPIQGGSDANLPEFEDPDLDGFRWMTVALFGESIEGQFERGVGQYPTVGDEVHLVTARDSEIIYRTTQSSESSISIGHISGTPSISANLDVAAIVTRHACVVGSTGSGKSNLMAVFLREIASSKLSAARVLVIDPHGEYSSALEPKSFTRLSAEITKPELRVPYWALSFDNFARIALGPMSDSQGEYLRDKVRALKVEAGKGLTPPMVENDVTADSPLPFSIRRLWYELREIEDVTYTDQSQTDTFKSVVTSGGDEDAMVATVYPPAGIGSAKPYQGKLRKGIGRQLEYLRTRVSDPRYAFMFAKDDYEPDHDGHTVLDLDTLLVKWLGSDRPITLLDVSGIPPEIVTTVVGSLLSLVYECLFWGMELTVGGKKQPLLIVVDEAHRFLPSGSQTPSTDICARIAREGRKYGIGLMPVTQRPSDIDASILSQCGSMIALRTTNASDRSIVASAVPDDLGNLVALLPSLRTGECLVLGEALQVPSRVRIRRAPARPVGDDPRMPDVWMQARPSPAEYSVALSNWRNQQVAP
jgi:uncharacterized protein